MSLTWSLPLEPATRTPVRVTPTCPFREILSLLTGDIAIKRAQGTISGENALRLWALLPDSLQNLIEIGPNLIDSFIASTVLARRATVLGHNQAAWADRLESLVEQRTDAPAAGLGRNGGRHPLEPVINELKRTYGDVEIDLDPAMGRHFVDTLLDTEPNQLPEGFRTALSYQTEGHPLFTVELLRAMQERGDLMRDSEGHWVEGPALDWDTLPARVEAVIEERVSRLEGGLRDVLAVASVEGETFTAQVVARVQGIGERPVLGALSQELERRHHLVQGQGEVQVDHQFLSRFRFTHTMFQKYLYNAFSPGERRLLHGAIAAVLEDLFQEEGEEVTVQLARHYAEAGQVKQAVDYLLRAGDRARDLYAHQEAIGFYEQALIFLKEQGADERAARALMKLGLTHHLAFNFQRARDAYQEGFFSLAESGYGSDTASAPSPPLHSG